MKRLSWKYIAGLIDGEGCLDVQVTLGVYVRPRVRMALVESCRPLLHILQTNHGGHLYDRLSTSDKWQSSVSWELAGYSQTSQLLRNIVNHLLIKHEQARFLLWMENEIKGKQLADEAREIIREELKAMKRDPHRLSEKAQERLKPYL